VGDRPANVDDDHQTGRAVDAMVPDYRTAAGKALGDRIAAWTVANSEALGVKYVIWNERIWSAARRAEGWRSCGSRQASCYSGTDDTAAHRDHVHVSTYGNVAGSADIAVASGKVVRPVTGAVLTASFGQCSAGVWVACHTGQDFALPAGAPIRAVMDGVVTSVGSGGAYGRLTKVQHAGGVASWYAHQSSQAVQVGQSVRAGQVIGLVGFTGNVRPAGPAGAHLHFEIRVRDRAVDPYRWLQSKGAA
jgi:murein DD-endopeptidase MepM/ murein hydrolase activator NlpD